jgi:hypothetical protein
MCRDRAPWHLCVSLGEVPFGFSLTTHDFGRSGQSRSYVRPALRLVLVPLAIMGVRMRVRHQATARARGTSHYPVLPELP